MLLELETLLVAAPSDTKNKTGNSFYIYRYIYIYISFVLIFEKCPVIASVKKTALAWWTINIPITRGFECGKKCLSMHFLSQRKEIISCCKKSQFL